MLFPFCQGKSLLNTNNSQKMTKLLRTAFKGFLVIAVYEMTWITEVAVDVD